MKLHRLHIRRHHLPHVGAGLFALAMVLGFSGPLLVSSYADAALLETRSVMISDSVPSATDVSYTVGFTTSTIGPIGSISVSICANYLFNPTDVCVPPSGFDGSAAILGTQTGVTDFYLDPSSTSHVFLLRRPGPSVVSATPLTYEFTNLTNPDYVGSLYIRIATYASNDGTGPEADYGNIVTSTADSIDITTEVPPYLLFCTGLTISTFDCSSAEGDQINFGELSTNTTRSASSQMLAATNAPGGYSVTLAGTTMTAGSNEIPAMTAAGPSRTGTSQFGINAVSNTNPGVGFDPFGPGVVLPANGYENPNQFKFNNGDIIASTSTTDDYRITTVSYIVNRSQAQAAGKYVATISYICLANF